MCKNIIQDWASNKNINISEQQFEKLAAFQKMVLNANEKMNLTAIKDDEGFAVKHIIDSLTLLPYIPKNASVIDVGTGAGFPGVVLAIVRPDIRISLLDSLQKRVHFLEESLDMLGLDYVECIWQRAEEFARTGAEYDVCTARAVAKMHKLARYTLPLLRPGGVFLAMKGTDVEEEIRVAKNMLAKYSGVVKSIDIIRLVADIRHSIVVIEKQFE